MEHAQIWRALDALAARHRLTASGLARAAGLDPTTFNKSKRLSPEGKPRWPSSESVTRALEAVGADYEDFAVLVSGSSRAAGRAIPVLPLRDDPDLRFDENGLPIAASDTIRFPGLPDDHIFAFELIDASAEPVFRAGDILVVQPTAAVRRGDRVVARFRNGAMAVRRVGARTEQSIELTPLDPSQDVTRFSAKDVEWVSRIVWASQ
jgi:phage repressor protein C with HTH and peptisase S24 domain